MVKESREKVKGDKMSDGVPVAVEGDREVLLMKRRGRWRVLASALWLALPLVGCGSAPPDYCGGCPTGSTCRRGDSKKVGKALYECVMVVKTVEVPLTTEAEREQ